MFSRRELLKIIGLIAGISSSMSISETAAMPVKPVSENAKIPIYRSVNGTPAENMEKVIALAGGIGSFIGKNDIVVIKPNVQWWNQGAPNIGALYALYQNNHGTTGWFFGRGRHCRELSPGESALEICRLEPFL